MPCQAVQTACEKKHSLIRVFLVCNSDKNLVSSNIDNQHFESRKRNVFKFLEHLLNTNVDLSSSTGPVVIKLFHAQLS